MKIWLNKKYIIAILVILVVTVYANSFFNRYAYDDYEFLVDNPSVHSLKNWSSFFTSSTSTSAFIKFAHYRPLATLNFAVCYSLWGNNPLGFHLLSLIYHLINVILVFLLLKAFNEHKQGTLGGFFFEKETKTGSPACPLEPPRKNFNQPSANSSHMSVKSSNNLLTQDILAFFGAAIFAVHPVLTEAVSWISSQGNLLSLIFYLTAIIVFLKYLDAQRQNQRIRGPQRELFFEKETKTGSPACPLTPPYKNFNWLEDKLLESSIKSIFIISLCFLLAIFTKEMAITLPLILLLINFIYGEESAKKPKQIIIWLAPLIAIAVGYFIIRTTVLQRVAMRGFWGGSPFSTMLTMPVVVFRYLSLFFVPIKQRVIYDLPVFTSLSWQPLLALAGLLVIGILTIFLYQRNRTAAFGIIFFFITLLPVMNIIPITLLIAERFLYFPILGLIIFVLALIDQFKGNPKGELFFEKETKTGSPACPLTPPHKNFNWFTEKSNLLLLILIIIFSAATFQRNRVWYDDLTLWTDNLKTSVNDAEVHFNLATALNRYQRYDEAASAYRKAIELKPNYKAAMENLAYLAPLGGVSEKEAYQLLSYAKNMKRVPHN